MGGKIPKLSALRGFMGFYPPAEGALAGFQARTLLWQLSLRCRVGQICGLNNSWMP